MRPARFTRIGILALLFGSLAPAPSLWAGPARIVEEAGADRVYGTRDDITNFGSLAE